MPNTRAKSVLTLMRICDVWNQYRDNLIPPNPYRKELGMNIAKSALKLNFVLSLTALIVLSNAGGLCAGDAGMVQILKSTGSSPELVLSVPDLYIKKNDVVIWMNGIEGEEIQVVFKDGKRAMDVSFSPKFQGFCLDSKSCFVTSFIPYASTSSLQFTETGTYTYSVSNRNGKLSTQGKIIVRDL